jgi:hypothetical protein
MVPKAAELRDAPSSSERIRAVNVGLATESAWAFNYSWREDRRRMEKGELRRCLELVEYGAYVKQLLSDRKPSQPVKERQKRGPENGRKGGLRGYCSGYS